MPEFPEVEAWRRALNVAASPPGFHIGWLLGMLSGYFELVGATGWERR